MLFRALCSASVDPDLAYEAAEASRLPSRGRDILVAIGAKTASQGARIKAEIKSQTAWIDILQRVIGCGIGPLIVRLAVPVSGLLYKALSDPGLFWGKGFASGR